MTLREIMSTSRSNQAYSPEFRGEAVGQVIDAFRPGSRWSSGTLWEGEKSEEPPAVHGVPDDGACSNTEYVSSLVSQVVRVNEAAEAVRMLDADRSQALQVVLDFRADGPAGRDSR